MTRLSINISDETAQRLRDLAADLSIPVTDVVRRAVVVYKLVEDEARKGKTLRFVPSGETE